MKRSALVCVFFGILNCQLFGASRAFRAELAEFLELSKASLAAEFEVDAEKREDSARTERLTFVLDLDQTLVRRVCISQVPAIVAFGGVCVCLSHEDSDKADYIVLRPGVREFLREIAKHFDLVIFTAASKSYAKSVATALFGGQHKIPIYHRDHCFCLIDHRRLEEIEKKHLSQAWISDELLYYFVKNIRKVVGCDMTQTIFMDDSSDHGIHCLETFVCVPAFDFKEDVKVLSTDRYLHYARIIVREWANERSRAPITDLVAKLNAAGGLRTSALKRVVEKGHLKVRELLEATILEFKAAGADS